MIKKSIFKILLGILSFTILLFALFFLFLKVLPIYNPALLKWVPILICILGFYIGGTINKNTPIQYLPFLFLPLLIFKPFRFLYFPFIIVLIIIGVLTLIVSRKEVKKVYKVSSAFILIFVFTYFLLSQPLILLQKGFKVTQGGDLVHAQKLWDFNTSSDNYLPDIEYIDSEGNLISLNSYKGKTLYITFWATWCPPCIAEKPILEQMKNEFIEDESIIFIDISIDRDTKRWGKYITNKNPKGIQLNTNDNDPETMQKFYFSEIPFHCIVSPEGVFKQSNDIEYTKVVLKDKNKLQSFIQKQKTIQ
ncbi:TlpA family protein disulfide reductase [Aquimarina macrocephali]|uniref:TlpA family protein disulfide reductase n=1 Tax=Aquimarina macrocephali TaxID=666563 RepID=UPI0004659145|nr:TlpA disulfide reductase family protein [Aquimarina macrocephali]